MVNRRAVLVGLSGVLMLPATVRASSLMRLSRKSNGLLLLEKHVEPYLPLLEEIDGYRSPDGEKFIVTAIRVRGSAENILTQPLIFHDIPWWTQDKAPITMTVRNLEIPDNWKSFSLEN